MALARNQERLGAFTDFLMGGKLEEIFLQHPAGEKRGGLLPVVCGVPCCGARPWRASSLHFFLVHVLTSI